jgi:hypothetical protein
MASSHPGLQAVAGDKFLVYFDHLFIEVLEVVWDLSKCIGLILCIH